MVIYILNLSVCFQLNIYHLTVYQKKSKFLPASKKKPFFNNHLHTFNIICFLLLKFYTLVKNKQQNIQYKNSSLTYHIPENVFGVFWVAVVPDKGNTCMV